MLKPIFIVVLSILFLSCEEESNHSTFYASNVDIDIVLPNYYVPITPTAYLLKLNNSKKEKRLITVNENSILSLLEHKIPFDLFYDSLNTNNHIILYEVEHIKLNSKVESQYLGFIEETFYNTWNAQNIAYNKLESKFFAKGNIEFIKIKYEKIANSEKMFTTQYIVSSNKRTITIFANNEPYVEMENAIKMIEL